MRRRLVALLVCVLASTPVLASADTLEPAVWPEEIALGSASNAVRFAGIDRYWTSAAMALALRGAGGAPFDSPDPSSGTGPSLAASSDWWGAATCPRSVILVAGDTPADALAAASLSDPTDRSDQPRLERVAAADPLFDPIGGFDRVDTFAAPVIATTAGRAGAAALAPSARLAVSDLRRGGCSSAREAIVVGGAAAVPEAVETELISLGFEEVFRVAGLDRYDTAARIATSLGTEPVPEGAACTDRRSDDGSTEMAFYANSVIEYRYDRSTCELHGRTVVLADGEVGADALAAGWWTSYWQVPVLLTAADGSLPPATRTALQTMRIDSLVILGGAGRIPVATELEAKRLTGATVGRFGGNDRYETSVLTAAAFGGWQPTGDPDDFDGDVACIAASTGASRGWPDALAAGPLCGRLTATAADRRAPARVLEPVADAVGPIVPPRSSHDAVPVLLVPAGSDPTAAVRALFEAAFPPSASWCRAGSTGACTVPGFAIGFGGAATVTDQALASVSAVVGGDPAVVVDDPRVGDAFVTDLALQPVFGGGTADGPMACVERGGVSGARWLATFADDSLSTLGAADDLVAGRAYDAGAARPWCVALGPDVTDAVLVAVSPSGRHGPGVAVDASPDHRVHLGGPMRHDGPVSSGGDDGTTTTPGAATTWRFRDAPPGQLEVTDEGASWVVALGSLTITVTRHEAAPTQFSAVFRLEGGGARFEGQARGVAVLVGDRWELAGRSTADGALGGFRATVDTNGTPDRGDDVAAWQVDAVRG